MKKLIAIVLMAIACFARAQTPLVIQAPDQYGNNIRLQTAPWAAQSFCSLQWLGKEFVNCSDHGRGL